MNNTNNQRSERPVTSLLKASIPEHSLMALQQKGRGEQKLVSEAEYFLNTLMRLGFSSVFDITRISRSRFIKRYDQQLRHHAGEIYDRAVSFSHQIFHNNRKQKHRKSTKNVLMTRSTKEVTQTEEESNNLPCYADLFPESWLDFCREGSVEAIDSPVSYLVDLFRFTQNIEADASWDAVTLGKRRPDIAQLPLNYDSTYQEFPELDFVNFILTKSIEHFSGGADVYSLLQNARFPFVLPYSFPNEQIHVGLSAKSSSLSQLAQIYQTDAYLPWQITKDHRNRVLIAATKLSQAECDVLTEAAIFSEYELTLAQLTRGYLSGSTTEIMPDMDLNQHGYVLTLDDDVTIGPETLVLNSASLTELPPHFDLITLACENIDASETVAITLVGESILTYQRVKARMVPFDESNDTTHKNAYSRQLRLSLDTTVPIDLTDGPFYGILEISAQSYPDSIEFTSLRFALALSDEVLPEDELWPDAADYFFNHYGITPEEYNDLKKVTVFAKATGGTVVEIEQLLAQGDHFPQVSANVVFENPIFNEQESTAVFPDTYHYGGKYINNARPAPLSIAIVRQGEDGWRIINKTSTAKYERINRFMRMARWSALAHDKLDLLLASAMQAEEETSDQMLGAITNQTISAYGLYCYLNEKYALTVDSFSAMLDKINIYCISPEIPFFDQIFNQPQLFETPFIQDNGVFEYTDSTDPNVTQICSGLSISTTTFQLLAPLVSNAFELTANTLNRSAEVLSALYRLVKLPLLFSLTPEEGLDLLKILSKVLNLDLSDSGTWDEQEYIAFVEEFIIHPHINADDWDTLDIIMQLEKQALFLSNSGFTTADLSFLLKTNPSPLIPTMGMVNFFTSIKQQLIPGILLSEASFDREDLPDQDWMTVLIDLIDASGLIKPYPLVWDQTNEQYLHQELVRIVDTLSDIEEEDKDDTVAVLEQIISQAKSAQDSLVATSVANEYGVSRDLVSLLLRWGNSSVMAFCLELLNTDPLNVVEDITTELLDIAYNLLLRVSVVSKFSLSVNGLFMRLAQPNWFSLEVVTSADLTLDELWLLNDYYTLLTSTTYTEGEVQDYFSSANNLDISTTQDCASLLASILTWEIQEVLDATNELDDQRAKTLLQVNWLTQIQAQSNITDMSADAVILSTGLAIDDDDTLKEVGKNVVAAAKEENQTVGEQLASSYRDALVGYYLDQLVPNDDDFADYRHRLQSIDQLYDFLLLDTQVSYKVTTAGVAQATKSIQQYINRITLNLEPGLSTTLEETYNWREFANRYGYWAANQQLRIYPEVYIDPTLRLGKTDLFFQLEAVLNQGKLNESTVERAVLEYLNNFEEVSNLEVLSGYGTGIEIDKEKIYFVAKTRTQPYLYYWRSLDMTEGEPGTLNLYPSAWQEWNKIDLPLDAAEPRTVRPVILNSRLYIVWLETSVEEAEEDPSTTGYITKLQLAHRKFDGSWSTPNILKEETLFDQMTDLIAVMDDTRSEEQLMLVGYTLKTGYDANDGDKFYDYSAVFPYACDTMLIESTDFPPSSNPDYSDIEYYGDKLVWFYTRTNENLYYESTPPAATTPEEAHARQAVARELVLYPYTNEFSFIIGDTTLVTGDNIVAGESGILGKGSINQVLSYIDNDINRLSIKSESNYKYFTDSSVTPDDKLNTILFCIWVWQKGEDDNDLNNGRLLHLEHKAYSKDGTVPDTIPYPILDINLSTVLELNPGWGDIVIQSGFSLVKEGESWDPNTEPYYLSDNGGRYTETYYVGKKLRSLIQNKHYNSVEYLQFPEEYEAINEGTIRLNTLFAKELISRANKGIEYVMEWEAQNIIEPPVTPSSDPVPIDFNGANGIYFWELFFHMPYLVSWRLNIEQRYEEATLWLNYIFNPNESEEEPELQNGKPRYWNSRPLNPLEDDNDLGRALTEPADPDAIAESDPVHYRKAIFRFYVDNLIDAGDMEYRQQSASYRIVARLSYDTAGALLADRPDIQMATTWETCRLEDAAYNTDSEQRLLETNTTSLSVLPVTYDTSVSSQDNGLFIDPFNVKLTELWDTLEQRLYNLRHNLTIDGKEINTPLYDTPIDPMDLQSQRYQRTVALQNAGASKFVVPNYRFTPMLNRAMAGVETLIQFGGSLLSLLERKDNINFDKFKMTQQLNMYSYTINLQQQAIEISEAELETNEASRDVAQQRYDHYKSLYDEDVSNTEQQVIELQASASSSIIASQGMKTAAAALDMAPNVFGLAMGGMNWGAPLNAMAESMMVGYQSSSAKAESLSVSESYRRRRQDWQIQYQQAELEVSTIDKQIAVQQRQVQYAKGQLEQIEAEYEMSQTSLDYFSNRFTNENLYIWMTSQLSSLYLQAYDAVLSLCQTAEAAWQYEIGQFDSSFVQTGAWNDLYQGLLVGETLKLGLIQMDQAYAYQNARRQEITKTISFKETFPTAFDSIKGTGQCQFSLSDFDDFVNLTNQRIQSVSVSLPALLGPYQDICATLTQLNSTIDTGASTGRKQVVLSHGVDDSGLFTLSSDDGRFLPFEGTGVASVWTLEFSSTNEDQAAIYDSLNDVILHVHYTARVR